MESEKWSAVKLDGVSVTGHTGAHCSKECPNEMNQKETRCQAHPSVPTCDRAVISGIIGPKCTAEIIVEGQLCNSLLDSGSQVTTVSKSFYDSYLSSSEILPLDDLIEVEGAGGQVVPYLGYTEVSIHFPENIAGKAETVSTLALVIPDYRFNAEVPVLVGYIFSVLCGK